MDRDRLNLSFDSQRVIPMKIERPNHRPMEKADLDQLATLKLVLEKAIADGVVTAAERDQIQQTVWADGKVSPEELNLVQDMVWSKISRGDLQMEWSP